MSLEPFRVATRLSTFLGFILFAAALGFIFRSGLLIAIAEASVALLLGCWWYCTRARDALAVVRAAPPRAFEDEKVSVTLALQNRGRIPLFLVQIEDRFAADVQPHKVVVLDRVGRAPVSVRYEAACSRGRGRFALGPICIAVSDPFGFFKRSRVVEAPAEIVVLPKMFPIRNFNLGGLHTSWLGSEHTAAQAGHSVNFYGTREYRSGDNIRHIHWRASARWGLFVLKEFERIASREVTLLLDCSRESVAGVLRGVNFESSIRIGASIAQYAVSRGHPVQLLAHAEEPVVLPPATGAVHLLQLLEALARARASGTVPLTQLLVSAGRFIGEGSTVVLLLNRSRFDRDAMMQGICELNRKSVKVIAVVPDESTFLRIRREEIAGLVEDTVGFLASLGVDCYVVERGADLTRALSRPQVGVRA